MARPQTASGAVGKIEELFGEAELARVQDEFDKELNELLAAN